MGSLIARYCLANMERQENGDHKVEAYISFDGPHKGANVPLGLQGLLDHIIDPGVNIVGIRANIPASIRDLDPVALLQDKWLPSFSGLVSQPAAQEMAMTFFKFNPTRKRFKKELEDKGYPNKVWKRIGIANGTSGKQQEDLSKGGSIIDWKNAVCLIDRSYNLPFGLGSFSLKYCPISHDIDVYAMDGAFEFPFPNVVSSVGVSLQPVPLDQFSIISAKDRRFSWMRDYTTAPSDPNADHVPGGKYSLDNLGFNDLFYEMRQTKSIPLDLDGPTYSGRYWNLFKTCEERILGVKVRRPCPGWDDYNFKLFSIHTTIPLQNPFGRINYTSGFCFVPTVSALDINSDDWFYDVASLSHYPNRSNTPFDDIYWSTTDNTDHAYMPHGNDGINMSHFIKEEISPRNVFIQNRIFPAGYENTFSAKGFIVLGKNVDPVAGRNYIGEVSMENNVTINLVHGIGSYVYFDDGFDAASFSGSIEVFQNANNCASDIKPVLDQAKPDWKQLRNQSPTPYTVNTIGGVAYATPPVVSEENFQLYKQPIPDNRNHGVNQSSLDVSASPNPFKDLATIKYVLPQKGLVTLILYNGLGEQILELVTDSAQESGSYEYGFNGSNLPNGVYLYKLIYNNNTITKRLILAR